jgi:hypothetical protein
MAGLMAQYASPALTVAQKEKLLADLVRHQTTHSAQAGRRVGPKVSARVYAVLRPREADDLGEEIVGVGVLGE